MRPQRDYNELAHAARKRYLAENKRLKSLQNTAPATEVEIEQIKAAQRERAKEATTREWLKTTTAEEIEKEKS